MTFPRLRIVYILPLALTGALIGCAPRDGVNSYEVPKSTNTGPRGDVLAGEYRILGALYPADRPEWYFKFSGTAQQVSAFEADFDKLAKTVKLQAEASAVPAFELPEGWSRTGPRVVNRGGIQVKTDEVVKFGPNGSLEVTISYIPGGGTQGNLDRWAGQLGLPGLTKEDAKQTTKEFDAVGTKGLRVDLRGPQNPNAGGGPFMGKK